MQILRNNMSSVIYLFIFLLSDGVRIAAMAKNCHNDYKMKFSLDDEFPDLSQHNNHMAKVQIPLWHKHTSKHGWYRCFDTAF